MLVSEKVFAVSKPGDVGTNRPLEVSSVCATGPHSACCVPLLGYTRRPELRWSDVTRATIHELDCGSELPAPLCLAGTGLQEALVRVEVEVEVEQGPEPRSLCLQHSDGCAASIPRIKNDDLLYKHYCKHTADGLTPSFRDKTAFLCTNTGEDGMHLQQMVCSMP